MNPFLATDLYKFSMMVANPRPTGEETFYLSFRKGGPLFVPIHLEDLVERLRPRGRDAADAGWLYLVKEGLPLLRNIPDAILHGGLTFNYVAPKNSWVLPREPVLTITGPSALVSWLEPTLVGAVSYLLQVATAAKLGTVHHPFACASGTEAELAALALDISIPWTSYVPGNLRTRSYENAKRLLSETGLSPERVLEVGLRSSPTVESHALVLQGLREAGITRTSNVAAAEALGLTPVGTMGHEAIMRFNGDDFTAFQKHREALPRVTFLLDTNDTETIGIPAAAYEILSYPKRNDGGRPDSGDIAAHFRLWVKTFAPHGLQPPWVFEDGLAAAKIVELERLRVELGYPEEKVSYGLGGYFVDDQPFKRSNIEMIYKLSRTSLGDPVMKFGNEVEDGWKGKSSLPGTPTVCIDRQTGERVVAQGNDIPPGCRSVEPGDFSERPETYNSRPGLSYEMNLDISKLRQTRMHTIAAVRERMTRHARD